MDEQAKKTSLRMIPYGLYVLTAEAKDGSVAAATVNWVTQASFQPPLGERQESCRLMFTQQSLRRRGADAVRSGGAKCSSAPCSSTTKLRCGAPTSPELGSTRGWG